MSEQIGIIMIYKLAGLNGSSARKTTRLATVTTRQLMEQQSRSLLVGRATSGCSEQVFCVSYLLHTHYKFGPTST
jgi:hypothetical protein